MKHMRYVIHLKLANDRFKCESACVSWSYGHFCHFWPILAKNWLPWQRPLDPCNQKRLLWIGRPWKPPDISNHILAISHRYAFICIYSNFSPKIGCHGNAPLSLVYGSVKDEFPDGTNLSPNQTLYVYVAYNWSYGHFWDFFGLFWPKFGCHGDAP